MFGIKAPVNIRRKGATLNPAQGLEPSSIGYSSGFFAGEKP
jgi:hypothetical protein